jgi:uncharacterized protein
MRAPPTGEALSLDEARRVAVAASGIAGGFAGVEQALNHLAVVQLDGINAVARAHELTLATRTIDVATPVVDAALWGPGQPPVAFEYWAHAASLIPLADWPLWEFRRRRTRTADLDWRPEPATRVRLTAAVADQGPLTMQQLRGEERAGKGWDWGPTKTAVEYLIWTGELACVQRRKWNRVFDLPERVIPAHLLHQELDDDAALATLIGRAGRVLGVATADDLADYLRIKRERVLATISDTPLLATLVESWTQPAWSHPAALRALNGAPAEMTRFVGPFDNLIWYRRRLQRLFAFDHVLEAYKPAARRQHGYFVLPLLHGTRFVGRADMKVEGGVLRILSLSVERGHDLPARCLDGAVEGLLRTTSATRLVEASP